MSLVLIESDTWRLWSEPDNGVQWMAAEVRRGDSWHSVVPDCRASDGPRAGQSTDAPLGAANFHMLPYSNRIRDARFEHQGREIQLENAAKHAIHGAVRNLPWTVVDSDASSLVCTFQSHEHTDVNWPWAFSGTIEQRVNGDELSSRIVLTNDSDTDMPAGFGWHPYFVRTVNGSQPTLTLPVSGVFPDEAGDCLPDDAAIALPKDLDFRTARKLDENQRIDCCLSGLQGSCVLDWQDGGIKLIVQASELCEYLILFNPDRPHFAVEPVTNANDAFNLASRSIASGVKILAPGESLEATMTLKAIIS